VGAVHELHDKDNLSTRKKKETPWAYDALPTLVGGHHSDRALRSLKVRETRLLELESLRMIQASPQTL